VLINLLFKTGGSFEGCCEEVTIVMFSHQTARGQRPLRAFGRVMLALAILITAFVPQFTGVALPVPFSDSNSTSLQTAQAASPDIVISQVYGGGNNSGATHRNDFIELFNRGNTTIDITGWKVEYFSAAGGSGGSTPLSGNIAPGKYFLIQQSGGITNGVALPTPDAVGTLSMGATNGRVDLSDNTNALKDRVGYGSANLAEGTATAALSNSTAAIRNGNGCTDNDTNNADFTVATPNPRNSATTSNPCGGPVTNQLTVSPSSLTFNAQPGGANPPDQNVNVGSTGASLQFSVEVSSTGWLTVTPLSGNTPASVIVSATTGSLAAGNYPGVITVTNVLTPTDFKVVNVTFQIAASQPYTAINQIQGAAGDVANADWKSPLTGQTVTTEGVVTAKRNNGFWMQEPNPDGDLNTSEGIFVFTTQAGNLGNAIVGNRVRVAGRVTEFRQSSPSACADTNKPTLTEIDQVASVTNLGVSATPITPTIVSYNRTGANIRQIPTQTIYSTPAMNQSDGIDFWESLEGMYVQVDDALVIGPTDTNESSFHTAYVVADNGVGTTTLNARKSLPLSQTDFNPERIQLVLPVGGPYVSTGDKFTVPLVGNVDIDCFTSPALKLVANPTAGQIDTSARVQRETQSALSNSDHLRISNMNIENLGGNGPQAKFDLLGSQIITNLGAPDIITLEEVQDDNGATDDSVTGSDLTLERLRAAVFVASSGTISYSYTYVAPQDDTNGGQPGGNIRVAFLFRTDRGLSFSPRPAPAPQYAQANQVQANGSLLYNPGLISPTNSAFNSSRKPLAAEFEFKGQRLIVIGNHWNSKGGDQGLFGLSQPPVLSSEVQRNQQATIVRGFINNIQAVNPTAFVVVNGDLNDFEFSNPLNIVKTGATPAGNLVNAIEQIPLTADRYTYKFEGNAQSLDHALYTLPLSQRVVEVNAVHINADFATTDPLRSSDHDPVTVVFNFGNLVPCNNQNNITIAADTGDGTVCGTLSYALKNAPVATVITLSTSVTLTGALQFNVPVGVQILGGGGSCTPTKFVINGNGVAGDGLRLQGDNYLANIEVRGFAGREIVANNQNGTKNVIDCSIVRS
jgi:predicted extracellular nuclease